MPSSGTTERPHRGRDAREARDRRAVNQLGFALLATSAVGLLLLGGAWPGARVVLHLGAALSLALAATLPDRALGAAGHLPHWTMGFALLTGAVAAALFPWPRSVLPWVAPQVARDWPDAAWAVAATDPEGTFRALAMLALVGGFGAAVVAWGAAEGRRWEFQRGVLLLAALLVGTAGLHLALGLESLFGILPTSLVDGRAFFAPFVSRNHLGATLLLLAPTVVGDAANHTNGSGGIPRGVLAIAVGSVLLLINSPGIALAVAAMLGIAAIRRWGWSALAVGAPAALIVVVTAPVWSWLAAPTFEESFLPRLRMWRAALVLTGWSPLFGIGADGFGAAIERVRTDCVARVWVHAHNVPLEWWLETGLAGAIAALAALAALRLGAARDNDPRAGRVSLGLAGFAVHNLIDFSVLLPGVAVLAGGLLAARIGVFGLKRATPPRLARLLLAGFGLLQLPAAAFVATQALADHATADLADEIGSVRLAAQTAARIGIWAPWRSEAWIAEAWAAEAKGDPTTALALASAAAARFPTDGDAQRRLALVFHRNAACDPAMAAARRARALQPANWRNATVHGRVSERCGETGDMIGAYTRALTCQAPPQTLAEAYAQFPVAIVWLDRLADHPDRLRRLALLTAREGDAATAALIWDRAATFPRYANQVEHVEVLIRAGRLADARQVFVGVQGAHPEHPKLAALGALLAGDAPTTADDLPSGALARRIRAAEAEGGPEAGQAELERQALLGHSQDPTLLFERARLALAQGDPQACVVGLLAARLPDHPVVGESARALLWRCEQASP